MQSAKMLLLREVIRRSISELCEADHRNDPEILRRWLASKTPEIVGSWIMKPGNSVLVAVDDDSILAVGSVTDAGEIKRNYISPDGRFRGVSRERSNEAVIDAPFSVPKRLIASTNPSDISRTALRRGIWHRAELPDVEAADRTRG